MKDRQRIPARAGIGGAIDAGMDGGMETVRLLGRVLGLAAFVRAFVACGHHAAHAWAPYRDVRYAAKTKRIVSLAH